MIFHNSKSAEKQTCFITCILFSVIISLFSSGCSFFPSIKKATKKLTFNLADEGLKKKIGITCFEDSVLQDTLSFKKIFSEDIIKSISDECSEIITVKISAPNGFNHLVDSLSPVSGQVNNLALADRGRRLGLSAIMIGSLVDIKVDKERSGILWFKDTYDYEQLQVLVEVYDTETGAKLIDENYFYKTDISNLKSDFVYGKKKISISATNHAIRQIAAMAGEDICDSLYRLPWKGYIISTEGQKFIISSGKRAGLAPGEILDVYDTGSIIKGVEGRQFLVPGSKAGEIKLTTVYADNSEAVLVSGKVAGIGSTVKRKN